MSRCVIIIKMRGGNFILSALVMGSLAGILITVGRGGNRVSLVSANAGVSLAGAAGASVAAAKARARQEGLFQEKDFEDGTIQFPEEGLRSVKQVTALSSLPLPRFAALPLPLLSPSPPFPLSSLQRGWMLPSLERITLRDECVERSRRYLTCASRPRSSRARPTTSAWPIASGTTRHTGGSILHLPSMQPSNLFSSLPATSSTSNVASPSHALALAPLVLTTHPFRHFAGSMEQWPMTTAGMKARTVQLATASPAAPPPKVWLQANHMDPRMFKGEAVPAVKHHAQSAEKTLRDVVVQQAWAAKSMSAFGDKLVAAAERE